MFRIITIFLIALFSVSCSNAAKTKLGLKTYGPDQNTVSERDHLKMPPVLKNLPEPKGNK